MAPRPVEAMSLGGPPTVLVGRDEELSLIDRFLARTAGGGGACLLSGEPGIGKTALLAAAAAAAAEAGMFVVRAQGVEFEADLSFGGINQVLMPLVDELERLDPRHRAALSVAMGISEGPPGDRETVADAVLRLLGTTALRCPVVVMVDDMQWMDRWSAHVLSAVAQRTSGHRIGLLAAFRSGTASFFECRGLPRHELQPLDEYASAYLLATRHPHLTGHVRQRLLVEAQGNPLALLELPTGADDERGPAWNGAGGLQLPGRRLGSLFADRIADLPEAGRRLLLLAALDGTGDLDLLLGAGVRIPAALRHAEDVGLVRTKDLGRALTFRHPAVRSSVVDMATISERREAHRCLADLLRDEPDRRAWHLAEATAGPDERIAQELEEAAHRILRRGDAVGAVALLLRSADLTPPGVAHTRRSAQAAYVGADVTGDLGEVSRLIADVRLQGHADSLWAAVATSYLLLNSDGDIDTAHRLLVEAIEASEPGSAVDATVLVEAVDTLLTVCTFGSRAELWTRFHAVVARLAPLPTELSLSIAGLADAARTPPSVVRQLVAAIDELQEQDDPIRIVRVGRAAVYLDRLEHCRAALWRVVDDGRRGGAIGSAISAVLILAFDAFFRGRWDEARRLAQEGLDRCETHGYWLLATPGYFGLALVAAGRGDDAGCRVLTDRMAGWAAPRGARLVQHYASHARALAALGHSEFEEAYRQAVAVSPPGRLEKDNSHALWLVMDLVEAAVRTHRDEEAAAHVAAVHEAGIAALSPRLALLVGGSAALAARAGDAGRLYEEALALDGAADWPFDLARVRLAYGEHLRRARATTAARTQLAAALEIFTDLGAAPWATRAESELRATGHQLQRNHARDTPAILSHQENEVALLAATGATNRQIAERLCISPRTVGSHLRSVFQKLGVSSRAALGDALDT